MGWQTALDPDEGDQVKEISKRRRNPALRVNRIFSLYVQPIGEVIRRHGLHFYHYADALEVFSHFSLGQESLRDALSRLEACVVEIKHWMTQNYLKVMTKRPNSVPLCPDQSDTCCYRDQSHCRQRLSSGCFHGAQSWRPPYQL